MPPGHGQAAAEAQPRRGIVLYQAQDVCGGFELCRDELDYRLELGLARVEIGNPGVSMLRLESLMRFDR